MFGAESSKWTRGLEFIDFAILLVATMTWKVGDENVSPFRRLNPT
jgi:hypothetical protein